MRAALHGLASVWKPEFRYKKAGVILLDLVQAGAVRGDLFSAPDTKPNRRLMAAMAALNGRMAVT